MTVANPSHRPFRLAIYSGVVVGADAVSGSVRAKLKVIRDLAAAGVPLEVTVYTHAADPPLPEAVVLGSVADLLASPRYGEVDAHLFEFGIRYDLFNAIFLVPPAVPILAVYHNVTPPALVDEEQRSAVEKSLVQKHNLFLAHRIACVSDFNRDDLLAFGVPAERLTVLHLAPALATQPRVQRRAGPVELLFVGRFVPSKGVLDLVRATARLRDAGGPAFRVTLAGNATFSSPPCVTELERLISENALQPHLRVVRSPEDAALAALYVGSDALVIPSYHEGFCLPVLEALASGCYVIGYDSTNLPHVTGGLGTLVATGDMEALSVAMASFVDEVDASRREARPLRLPLGPSAMDEDAWRQAVEVHLGRYSASSYRRGVIDLLGWAAAASPRGAGLDRALRGAAAPPAVGASR